MTLDNNTNFCIKGLKFSEKYTFVKQFYFIFFISSESFVKIVWKEFDFWSCYDFLH